MKWRILGATISVQIAVAVLHSGVLILAPFLKSSFQLTGFQVGLVTSAIGLGSMVALPVVGWLVDVLSDRVVLLVGGLVGSAAGLVLAGSSSYIWLLAVLPVLGASSATPTLAGSKAIFRTFPPNLHGTAIGMRQAGFPLGSAVASVAMPALALALGWREAIVAGAILVLIGAAVARFLYTSESQISDQSTCITKIKKWPMTRPVFRVGATFFMLAMVEFTLLTYLILYMKEYLHIPVALGGIVLGVTNLVSIVGRVAWGVLSDRYFPHRRRVLIIILMMGALVSTVVAFLPLSTPWLVVMVIMAVFGLTALGWNGLFVTMALEMLEPSQRGRGLSISLFMANAGIMIGPALFGLIVDLSGGYRTGWLFLSTVVLIGTSLLHGLEDGYSPAKPDH